MPFNVPPTEIRGARLALPIEIGPVPQAPLIDRLSAAFSLGNATVDLLTRPERAPAEPGFNPLDHLEPHEEPIAHVFADANSRAELNQRRQELAHREELRRTLGTGATGLLAQLVAGVLDPIPLLMGTGVFRAVQLGRIVAGAAAGAADLGSQELILQQSQPERDPTTVVAGMVLGAAAGGLLGAVVPRAAVEDLATAAKVAQFESPAIGAAPVRRLRPEDTELAPGFGLPKAFGHMGKLFSIPSLRILNSQFAAAREAVLRLTDVGVLTKGALRGVRVPESADLATRSRLFSTEADLIRGMKGSYREFKRQGGKASEAEFRVEVGRAMRRAGQHPNAVVSATAKALSALVKRVEQEGGELFPPHLTVEGFPRDFAVGVLRARYPEFINRVSTVLQRSGVDPTDAEDVARTVADSILGTARLGRVVNLRDIEGVPDSVRAVLSKIPDDVIEDFLEDDALLVLGRWLRPAIADVELARAFGGKNAIDGFEDAVRKIKDEALAAARANPEPKHVARLDQERDDVIDLLTAIFNRVRGLDAPHRDPAFDNMKRFGRITRNVTSTMLMGAVAISNLGDIASSMIKLGTTRLFGTAVADMGRGFRGIKMSRRQAQQFGTALEMVLHNRRSAITGAAEYRIEQLGKAATLGERTENIVQRGTDLFFRATLLDPLIDALKSATSAVVSTRILEAARKVAGGGTLSRHQMAALASVGIDDAMLRRFAKQAEHWEQIGGGPGKIIVGGVEGWTDAGARRTFGNALLSETDTAVVTPFSGDLPRLFDSEWGRVILQFKRFSAGSTGRFMTRTAQRLRAGEITVLGDIAAAVGIGTAITALKDLSIAGEIRERTLAEWVSNAVDRSGVAAMAYELNALADVFPGYGPITLLTGQTSRFEARTPFERLLGPTAGQIEGLSNALRRVLTNAGESPFTQAELKSLSYLIPGQNLIGVGLLMNKGVEALGEELNLPEREPSR